jgi:hypothetical protein
MLIRILADNPGASFTRNLDAKFTSTVKELLRNGKEASVQQILRETLQALYMDKAYDTNLTALFAMWSKESGVSVSQSARAGNGQSGSSRNRRSQHIPGQGQHGGPPMPPRNQQLPPPVELAARIEEAKTSAKLMQQLVQSTPPAELQDHDLIKEFAERCQNAQRSMQAFMNSTEPSPDDDTMQTLIETSEQLSLAASKHQRAVLQARRSGHTASPPPVPPPNSNGAPQIPPFAPIGGYSSPGAAPSSTFAPTAVHDLQAYSPPPAPPSMLRKALNRRSTAENNGYGAVPPSLKPGGPPPPVSKMSVNTSDDPFADDHRVYQPVQTRNTAPPQHRISTEPVSASSYASDEDIYRGPYGSQPNNPATAATVSPVSPNRPRGPREIMESWRRDDAGSPESYNPGFHSTPSYIKRQESSGENITMRGAATDPPEGTGTIAEERVQESAGRYGRVSPEVARDRNGSGSDGRIGPLPGSPRAGADISPVSTRNEVPLSAGTTGTGYGFRS